MTNHTNLEYLFQATAIPERSANGAAAPGGRRGGFDDHLLQASSASGSRSKSESRSASDVTEREPNRSLSETEERASGKSSAGQTEAASTAYDPADEETTIDEPSEATAVSTDEPVNAAGDGNDEGDDSDTSTSEESDDVAVAIAIADGEAIRHAQTVAAQAQTGSADADAKETTVSDATKVESQPVNVTGDDDSPENARKLSLATVQDGVEPGAVADDSNTSTQPVDVGPKVAESADVNEAEIGKSAGRKEKTNSGARRSNSSAAITEDSISRTVENSGEGRSATGKNAPTQINLTAADPSQAEDSKRHRADGGSERKGDAAATSNRAPVSDVIATPATQLAGTTINADGTSDSSRSAAKTVGANGEPLPAAVGKTQRGAGRSAERVTAGKADDVPRVDAARFVGRVAKAVQVAHERGGALQLRLSPPELGSVRLELTVQNGVMTASLETETPAARQVLLDHLPALRDRLAEQNIRVERFDVNVRQDQHSGGGDSQARQHHERQHQPQQSNHRHSPARVIESDAVAQDTPTIRPHAMNGSINVLA